MMMFVIEYPPYLLSNMKLNFSVLAVALALTSSAFSPWVASAQMPMPDKDACVMTPHEHIPSGLLAMMAYRGSFKAEGIPGYNTFVTEFLAGKVTAQDIVEAAVKGCVLDNTSGMAESKGYVSMVDSQVRDMIREMN